MTGKDRTKLARRHLLELLGEEPVRWLAVDVAGQNLALIEDGRIAATWPVSTAAAGVDARENSLGTPPGLHRIARKIGAGEAPGMIFKSRRPTGQTWSPPAPGAPAAAEAEDLILSRVLTLVGLEAGVNSGPGVDSLARYIYLHGTNHEDRIGEPVSHGCIRLNNRDVIDLFDRVAEGDPVVILGTPG